MERTNNKHSGSGYIYLKDVQHIYPGSCLYLMGFSGLKASRFTSSVLEEGTVF